MSKVYCKAPWTSVSYMPGGKYSPCCTWAGQYFDSQEEMTEKVGGAFLRGEVPKECGVVCKPDRPGYRDRFQNFETDYKTHTLQMLDFRNNNLCNLKCRSCYPTFSTSWASEAGQEDISLYQPINVSSLDLSAAKIVYFAGGEPLLNPQHYQVLESLIEQNLTPRLLYSTNMTVLGSKEKHVSDLWPHFNNIEVYASVDAVGKYASIVRSGSNWDAVQKNIEWMRTQPNVELKIATVISAINIWWLPELFEYFSWAESDQYNTMLADENTIISVSSIPLEYREPLIRTLEQSPVKEHVRVKDAIQLLKTKDTSHDWYKFLAQQLIQDSYRKESWFTNLPIKQNVYRKAFNLG